MFTLKINYCWNLSFIDGIKCTGKEGKVSSRKNQADDGSVKSYKLMWIQSAWWSEKTGIWLFKIWSTWWTFPSQPFPVSLHKISECDMSLIWLRHLVTHEQMATRIEICEEWLEVLQKQLDLFEEVLIYDKSWMHYFEPLTRQERAHWKSQSSPKSRKSDNSPQWEGWCLLHSSMIVTSFTNTTQHKILL